ncbi:MAG: hypothetical protein AB7E36_03375 [Salinivirgaceae bacterium]
MNLFFYCNVNHQDLASGITQKVSAQISTLEKMGYEVYYSGYTDHGVAVFKRGQQLKYNKFRTKNGRVNRFLRRWDLLRISRCFVRKDMGRVDYAYMRFHFFDAAYLNLLKQLKDKGAYNIIESHLYPYRSRFFVINLLDKLYTPKARKYIDLVAAMSNHSNIWECKTVQVDNSIDMDNYPENKNDEYGGTINLIAVAYESAAHGYSKIVTGLHHYYKEGGKQEIVVNFVGNYLDSTKKMIEKLNLSDHFVFWGKKSGVELDKIFQKCDIGLGAFSYRKDEDSGSCIKTKEYFARGIPFVNGWREPAFDETYPYVLKVDSSKDSVDMNQVIEFYYRIKKNKHVATDMRNFAKNNYTWQAQFDKVFNAINGNNV